MLPVNRNLYQPVDRPDEPDVSLRLSLLSKVFLGAVVLGYLATLFYWPAFAAELLVLLVPPLVLAWAWRKFDGVASKDLMVKLFGAGFLPGALLVMICEMILGAIFTLICFMDQLDDIKKQYEDRQADDPIIPPVKRTAGFYIFLFLVSFVVAGCTEEMMKFILVRESAVRRNLRDFRAYILYGAAAACGFSTIENVLYAWQAASQGIMIGLYTCLERIVLSTPLHVGTAVLIGCGLARQNVFRQPLKTYQILFWPVLLHGGFDFGLMLLATADTSEATGLVVSALFAIVILAILVTKARMEVKQLQAQEAAQPDQPPELSPQQGQVAVAIPVAEQHAAYTPEQQQPSASAMMAMTMTQQSSQLQSQQQGQPQPQVAVAIPLAVNGSQGTDSQIGQTHIGQ